MGHDCCKLYHLKTVHKDSVFLRGRLLVCRCRRCRRCRRCTGGWPRDRMTADSQADTHKRASLSSLPLLLLLRAHHVGLAPPYKIPRGSGSAEEELPSSVEFSTRFRHIGPWPVSLISIIYMQCCWWRYLVFKVL